MLLALFAGIHVSDYESAKEWYVRLLGGEPSLFPNDIEAVWELAEHRSIYIRLQPEDELGDPDDLALGCSVNGETMQDARTSELIFSVPRLIAELSAVVPMLPGDIVFTGTPSGIGIIRKPPRCQRPWRRPGVVDRGHRHHPQPVRMTARP